MHHMNQPYLIWAAAFRHASPRSGPCSRSCFANGDWVLDAAWLCVVGWLACPDDEMKVLQKMIDVQPANYINIITVAVSTNIETHHLPRATERETKVQTTFYVSKHHFLRTLVPNHLNKLLANFGLLCTKTKKKTLGAKFASCTCASVSCFISFNRRWASMLVGPALYN